MPSLPVSVTLNFDLMSSASTHALIEMLKAAQLTVAPNGAPKPPADEPEPEDDSEEPEHVEVPDAPPVPAPEPPPAPVAAKRGRTARKAAAEQANGTASVAVEPFIDDVEEEAAPSMPAPVAEPEDEPRTPKQCLEGSLAILRQVWGRGGGEKVKALQKVYRVIKFTEIGLDRAPSLWKDSVVLAREYDVRLPSPQAN